MCRIETRRLTLWTALLLSFLVAGLGGCSDDYQHERLGPDSQRFQQVSQMLDAIRAAGPDGLDGIVDRHGVGDLSTERRTALQAALRQLAIADEARLVRMDAFGEDVYRATFELSMDGETSTASMLLVETSAGLRWAGMN
jgi:hypothetical protein